MTTKLRAASFQDNAVTTAKIAAAAITNAKIADGAVDSDAIGSSAIVADKLGIGQIGGRRNIVINGAMQVAQRGTSQASIGNSTGSGYFTVDRYNTVFKTSGLFTMSQSTVTDLPGFANALKLDCTTADTSIAADEYFLLQYKLEGQNLQQFKKGTSSAEKMTVSFYVKGNANATYVCELYDQDNAREIAQTFSVTSSWNRVVLTYDGDTTGAFDDDNVLSMYISFWLHSGSNHNSGTLSTTWTSITNANRAVGISSFFDSTDRTLEITGLQLEAGSQATPFEHRSFGEELALCQRYFCQFTDPSSIIGHGGYQRSDFADVSVQFPVPMRTAPSLVQASGSNYYGITRNDNNENFNSFVTAFSSSNKNVLLYVGSGLSGTQGIPARFYTSANGSIAFNAEL